MAFVGSYLWRLRQAVGSDLVLMPGAMVALRELHDHVVVVAPSLQHSADGLATVHLLDGVVVVAELEHVRKDDLARARELVSGVGGRLLGAVQVGA